MALTSPCGGDVPVPQDASEPLVTIGLPTFNRVDSLHAAIGSALKQDYRHIELVISDNASSDDTQRVCQAFVAADSRVRYIRQPYNKGPFANFREVMQEARGDYFMWLADDDWVEANYVSSCLAALQADPRLSLAGGRVRYVVGGRVASLGVEMCLLEKSPVKRVLAYWRTVDDNSVFYGLMPRRVFAASTLAASLGADWLWVAGAAAHGKVMMIPETTLNRSIGARDDLASIAASEGLPRWSSRFSIIELGLRWVPDVARGRGPYAQLPIAARVALTLAAAPSFLRRQLWYEILRHGNAPAARPVKRLARVTYDWLHTRSHGRFALRFPGYTTRLPR